MEKETAMGLKKGNQLLYVTKISDES